MLSIFWNEIDIYFQFWEHIYYVHQLKTGRFTVPGNKTIGIKSGFFKLWNGLNWHLIVVI